MRLQNILKYIVEKNIQMLYYFTEKPYAYIFLGLVITYALYSKNHDTRQLICLMFTFYFYIISGLYYIVSQTPAYHKSLVNLVGQKFLTQHLGTEISSRQVITISGVFVILLIIELITNFSSLYKLDNDIAIIVEMYEKAYGLNQLEWNENIKEAFLQECDKIIGDHIPGGWLTRMVERITDFIHSSK